MSDEEAIFPALPPLRSGHPDVQLRNGIMRASRLAAANEPGAEKCLFRGGPEPDIHATREVEECLPEIEPHYGTLVYYILSMHILKCF